MPSQKLNFKKIVNRLILLIGLGVGAHIVFVLSTTEKSLLKFISGISYIHLAIIIVLLYLPWIFYALRVYMWSIFLKEEIHYADLLRVVITTDLASALSPTAVGGAPVKAALLLNREFSSGNVGFLLTYGVIEDIIFYTLGIVLAGIFSSHLVTGMMTQIITFTQEYSWYLIGFFTILVAYIYLLRKNKIPVGFRLMTYIPISIKYKIYNFKSKLSDGIIDMKSNFKMALKHGKLRMLASFTMLFLQWLHSVTSHWNISPKMEKMGECRRNDAEEKREKNSIFFQFIFSCCDCLLIFPQVSIGQISFFHFPAIAARTKQNPVCKGKGDR